MLGNYVSSWFFESYDCSVPPCSASHLSLPARLTFSPESTNMAPKASGETSPWRCQGHYLIISTSGCSSAWHIVVCLGLSTAGVCRDKLNHHRFISSFILLKEQRGAWTEVGCTLPWPKDRMLQLKHISVVLRILNSIPMEFLVFVADVSILNKRETTGPQQSKASLVLFFVFVFVFSWLELYILQNFKHEITLKNTSH